jgi:hypothetical protein
MHRASFATTVILKEIIDWRGFHGFETLSKKRTKSSPFHFFFHFFIRIFALLFEKGIILYRPPFSSVKNVLIKLISTSRNEQESQSGLAKLH